MKPGVDTSSFPIGQDIDYESEHEIAQLAKLRDRARDFLSGFAWAPPIADMVLAFGVAPIVALFLARFGRAIPGSPHSDTELWMIVGDLPSAYFVCDKAQTPAAALEVYCELMDDWADRVLSGADLSESYPVNAVPTAEHAEMLKGRLGFIRKNLIPLAI